MLSALGDVIGAAAELVRRLGEVAEGLAYEEARCVCSVGTLAAGTAVNVVPTSAQITGTLRTFTEAQRAEALERLRALCAEVAEQRGVEVELELPEHTPAVVNDAAATDVVEREAVAVLGPAAVVRVPPTAPSDDVSEFLSRRTAPLTHVRGRRRVAAGGRGGAGPQRRGPGGAPHRLERASGPRSRAKGMPGHPRRTWLARPVTRTFG